MNLICAQFKIRILMQKTYFGIDITKHCILITDPASSYMYCFYICSTKRYIILLHQNEL